MPPTPFRAVCAVALCAVFGALIVSGPARAQEGAAWPQFQGDEAHTGTAPDGPEPPYTARWDTALDASQGQALSSPVAVADTVVVSGPDAVYALDVATGEVRWSVSRDGPPAAPAIARVGDADAVVYSDGRGEDSTVRAADVSSGDGLWDEPPSLGAEVRIPVTVSGDRAFVVDEDDAVHAIDVADGEVAWSRRISGTVVGPVAVADGRVFVLAGGSEAGSSARLVALDAATGEPAWAPVVPEAAASFGSIPAVDGDDVVVALEDGAVHALSVDDGSPSWRVRIAALVWPFSSPAVADGAVYVADRTGGLHRIAAGAGREWLFEFNEPVLRQSPLVVGDVVLLAFEDGSIGAVDAVSGNMVFRTPGAAAPVTGMAVADDALIVVRSDAGRPRVIAFETDPDGALIDVHSPTIPEAADLAGSFAIAFIVVAGLTLLAGRLLARRVPIEDPSSGEDELEEGA